MGGLRINFDNRKWTFTLSLTLSVSDLVKEPTALQGRWYLIPILLVRKLRLREMKQCVWVHTAILWPIWYVNPGEYWGLTSWMVRECCWGGVGRQLSREAPSPWRFWTRGSKAQGRDKWGPFVSSDEGLLKQAGGGGGRCCQELARWRRGCHRDSKCQQVWVRNPFPHTRLGLLLEQSFKTSDKQQRQRKPS